MPQIPVDEAAWSANPRLRFLKNDGRYEFLIAGHPQAIHAHVVDGHLDLVPERSHAHRLLAERLGR
jgi:hypothetical protein